MSSVKAKVDKSIKKQDFIFDRIKPKQENLILRKLKDIEGFCRSIHYKYPLLFLLFGTCLSVVAILGVQDFDVSRLETDVTKLISPLKSKTLHDQEDISRLFSGEITASHFYPHQTVIAGFDLSVMHQLSSEENYLNQSVLDNERKFHQFLSENVTVPGANESLLTFKDLCAMQETGCVIQGSEIFEEAFQEAMENHNITYPVFRSSDLSDIFGDVKVENGTLISAKVLKLKYYLRYDTEFYKSKSSRWIKAASKLKEYNSRTYYTSSSALTRSEVEFDLNEWDLTFILPVSFGVFAVAFLFGTGLLPKLLIISVIGLASLGIISFLQIKLLKLMAVALVFVLAELLYLPVWSGETGKEALENCYSVAKHVCLNALFFGIGISSDYLLVRNFSIAACISMVVCLVVSVTATSLLEVIEQIRKRWPFQTCTSSNCSGILSVLGSILSCLFIVKYDKSNDDGNDQVNDQVNSQGNDQVDRQAVTLSQFGSQDADNQTTEQRKEGQISTEPSHLSTSSFCSSRLKRGVKFTIAFLLYMGYLGGAIYGLLNTNTRLDLCTLSDSDSEWSSFCHINSVSFNQDFIVTLVVKPEKQMNINRTDAAVSELLSAAKSQNVFNPKFQINWLSAFSSNASYNKENFRESLSLFLHENKLYQNDVIHDFSENESDVRAFRIYLKTKDVLGQKDIVEVMKAVRELEDRIPFKCYFYAPVFMLYEGSFSWTADLLKTTGIAFGVAVLLLSVFSYHYRFYALLILLQALSIFIGVIGFASIWNFSLSFVTTIPMLLMMGSVVKIFVIQWDGFLILLVGYLSVVIFMLTFTFPAFIMKSVFIPYFLYCVSLLFHSLIFMPQLVLVWLKKSKYKKFHNHGLTSESETTVQHFHI